jgi:hypothetical protein
MGNQVMDRIENRTFDELKIGDTASLVHTLTFKDVEIFAAMSGDVNPAHVDPAFAKDDMFHKIVAHGMWGGALFSTVLGTELPGAGRNLSRSVAAVPSSHWPRRHDHCECEGDRKEREASRYARLRGTKPEGRDRDHRDSRGDRSNGKNLQASRGAPRGSSCARQAGGVANSWK